MGYVMWERAEDVDGLWDGWEKVDLRYIGVWGRAYRWFGVY